MTAFVASDPIGPEWFGVPGTVELMDDITDHVLGGELLRATEAATREERANVVSVAAALRTRVSGPEDPLNTLVAALDRYPADPNTGGEPGDSMLALWARSVA